MAEATAAGRSRNPSRRWLQLGLGVLLSGAALALAFRKTSIGEVSDAMGELYWPLVPLMFALKALTLVVKAVRWKVELRAMRELDYTGTFRAIGLGYFGNLLLPFKLGELLRVGLLKRHNPSIGAGEALATIAAERALDGAVLALMVAAVLGTADVPPWVYRGTLLLLVAMIGAIAVSMLKPVHDFAVRLLPARGIGGLLRKVIDALSRGTSVVRDPRALALVVALTALAWLIEALVFYCATRALDVDLGFQAVLIVTLLLSVGLLIPSAPGQVGTHQALTTLFLAPFAVGDAVAVSVSVVLQMVALTVLGSIGGVVMVREAGARELLRRSARGADSAAETAAEPPSEEK